MNYCGALRLELSAGFDCSSLQIRTSSPLSKGMPNGLVMQAEESCGATAFIHSIHCTRVSRLFSVCDGIM